MYPFICYYLCVIKMIGSYLIAVSIVTLYQPFTVLGNMIKYDQICPANFSSVATLLIWCDGPKPSQIKKKMLHFVNTTYVNPSLAMGVADCKLTCLRVC